MLFNKASKDKEESYNLFDILKGKEDNFEYLYSLMDAHAIDLIAKAIAKTEIETFEEENKTIENKKGELYWVLNIQPNFIETGFSFKYKLVTKLLIESNLLIVKNEKGGKNLLYIADEYEPSIDILYGKTFKNVKVSDNEGNSIQLKKSYNKDNSIYLSINDSSLSTSTKTFKNNISNILKAAQKNYIKSNTPKWRLKSPGNQPTLIDMETKKPLDYKEYKEKITEGLLDDNESIVLLSELFELINLNKDKTQNIEDFEKIFIRTGNSVAQKWNIPQDIFWGSKTEKSTGNDDFITFAVNPYFKIIEDGFNIALVGKESYLKGEYVQFNKTNLNHRDILDSANGIDKLTADGFSRNEINKFLGLPKINEAWADEHNITKNYANVKGGVENE